MTKTIICNPQGPLPAFGLRIIILVGILASFGASQDRPKEEPLRYITEKEMTAIVERINSGFPGKPNTQKRTWSSAREKAQSFRGHWAYVASKRLDARYRLVPPELPEAQDRALAKWIDALESRSDSPLPCAVDTMSIYRIQSESLDQLFPEWTFLFVPSVAHTPYPPPPRDSGALDWPFCGILAIAGNTVHAFSGVNINNLPFGYRATTDFPSFVQSEGIRIRNEKDAARFWDAYCSFHRLPWSSGKHMRVDGTLWRLNDKPAQPGEQVLEVGTDPDGKILRMKLIKPDTPKQPQEKKAPQGKAAQDQLSKRDGFVTFQEG